MSGQIDGNKLKKAPYGVSYLQGWEFKLATGRTLGLKREVVCIASLTFQFII